MAGTSPPLIHDFTDDEIEVANIVTDLKTLMTLFEPTNIPLSTPTWLSKRPRSSSLLATKSQPDQPSGGSAVVSGKGNCRNASPDSPLLLNSSPESCCVQGNLESTRGKKGTKKQSRPLSDGCKKDGDDSAGVIRSKKKLKRETMRGRDSDIEAPKSDCPVQLDMSLTLYGHPRDQLPISHLALAHGDRNPNLIDGPTSPHVYSRPLFLFDLNLLPESTYAQSTPPDEKDRKLGQMPCFGVTTYDGSSQAETTKAARKRRLEIFRMKNGKCGASKAHPSSRHH